MRLSKVGMILIIGVSINFLLSPAISSLSSLEQNTDITIMQTGFENEWYLDEDNDFYAPSSLQDIWDIDGLSTNPSNENTFWNKVQVNGNNNQQYIHTGSAAAGVWPKTQINDEQVIDANDEWLITPSMDLSEYYDITLSFWSQYHPTITILMPFYELRMVNNTYLVKISTDNGKNWKTIANLREEDKYYLGVDINQKDYWNMYDAPIEIPLDYYASGVNNVKIAWHYYYSGIGPAERWMIDDVKITGKKDTTSPLIKLLSPKEKEIYVNNNKIGKSNQIVLIGDFTVKVDPTDDGVGTSYVDFKVDGTLTHQDDKYPYQWDWTTAGFGKKQVTVTAVDYAGYSSSINFDVFKLF